MTTNAPVESKVWAATVGGGSGAVVGEFLKWLLGILVFGGHKDAPNAQAALDAVPFPVSDLIPIVLAAGGAFYAGWRAKHTSRPPEPTPTVPPSPVEVPVEPPAPVQE